MGSNTDEVTGDHKVADNEDASRALVVQATERAIVASFAPASEPLAQSDPPGLGGVPLDAADIPAALTAEAASVGFRQGDTRTAIPFDPTPASPQTAFNPTLETVMTTAEDFMAFGQANIEAMVKSSQIWATGVQDLSKHMAVTAQAQLDQTMSTWKAMVGVKSVKEALDMQTGLARNAIETVVSETGKLTDASMKLSEQALAPITARLSVTAEKFGRVAA